MYSTGLKRNSTFNILILHVRDRILHVQEGILHLQKGGEQFSLIYKTIKKQLILKNEGRNKLLL